MYASQLTLTSIFRSDDDLKAGRSLDGNCSFIRNNIYEFLIRKTFNNEIAILKQVKQEINHVK